MTLDQFIRENDSKPQAERLSNVAIAEKFNTSEASVRRHRKILNRGPKKDEFFQVPVDAITSRGASIRTADGSWQKITYIPEKAAIAEASKFDDLLDGIEGFTADVAPDCGSDMAMVFGGADYQALSDDTPMLTTNGWTTHGELRPGDCVYAPDGRPVQVIAVTGSSEQNLYDVEFDHGTVVRASGNHLWQGRRKYHPRAYSRGEGGPSWEWRDLVWTTEEIATKITHINNVNGTPHPVRAFTVDLPDALDFGVPAELPVDPYVLGLWLGNGNHSTASITGDARDQEGYARIGTVSPVNGRPGTVNTYVKGIIGGLRSLGVLNNKHIPDIYLYGSKEQRISLLQGLMDSDGYCSLGGVAEFTNTNKDIADGLMFLLASLGWKYSVVERTGTLNGVEHKQFWRVQIPTDTTRINLFRFPRKGNRQNNSSKEHVFLRQVQRVTPVGRGMAQCITVEGGLYLAGRELVVTHNCGKAGESGGGTKDTIQRVLTSASRFAQRAAERKPQAIVVTDCGDITENMFNVPGHQLSTNDLDLADQIRVARRLQLEVLKMLSPLAPEVYYVSVPSNHGQVRTGPKAAVGGVENDFGVEISYQLEDICEIAESPALRNVQFVRPDKYAETAVLTVADTTLAFNHGHRASGGQAGQDKWWTEQDHGRQPGWNADILVVAHYHNMRLEQSGDGRWIIHLSASEPSSDYFARSKGTTSKRGVTCFSVQRGMWSDLEIL